MMLINNFIKLVLDSFLFVLNQNMFSASMGFTTAIGMVVGVILYDGDMDQSKKGIVSIFSYGIMIIWTSLVRILPNAVERGFVYADGRPFASIVTIFYITIFWTLGVQIGVRLFKHKRFREK